MEQTPVIVVDMFRDMIAAADSVLFPTLNKHINYQHGSSIQILTELLLLNKGITEATKGAKYPLVALFQPFLEVRNGSYYATVTIPKLVIATLTTSTSPTIKRYEETFIPVLYPVYYELLRQIARCPYIVGNDPDCIKHKKQDNPGSPPPPKEKGAGFNDYVDAIEIYDLELLIQLKTNCKQ